MLSDRKILIDCDPGTDDALALLLASVYLRDRLLCLVSTYGNTSVENTHGNLLGLSALLKLENVPIFRGASCPMGRACFTPTDYHGTNGLCGITLPYSAASAEAEGGLERMYGLMKQAGEVIYVALGPLTNLALLLKRYPDAADHIAETVIMGGGFAVGNTDCGAEYNFSLDPSAVKTVFEKDVKKKLVPLDLTHTLAFDEKEIEWMVGGTRECTEGDRTEAWAILGQIFYRNLDSSLREGNEGAIIHDGAAVACLCGCGYSATEIGVLVKKSGRIFEDEIFPKVDVVRAMNKAELLHLMKEAFSSLKQDWSGNNAHSE